MPVLVAFCCCSACFVFAFFFPRAIEYIFLLSFNSFIHSHIFFKLKKNFFFNYYYSHVIIIIIIIFFIHFFFSKSLPWLFLFSFLLFPSFPPSSPLLGIQRRSLPRLRPYRRARRSSRMRPL